MEEKEKKARDLFTSERVKRPRAKRTPNSLKIMRAFWGKDTLTLEELFELTKVNLLSLKLSLGTLTKDDVLEETPEGWSIRKPTDPIEIDRTPIKTEPMGSFKLEKVEFKAIKPSYSRGPGGAVSVSDEKTLKRFLREDYIVTEEYGKAPPKHWTLRRSSGNEKIVWDCDLSSRGLTIEDMVETGCTIIHQGEYPRATIYKKWWQIRRHPHA